MADISDMTSPRTSDSAMMTDAHFFWVSELTMSIMVTVFVVVITALVVLFFGMWKFKSKVLPSQAEATRRYRFRKRDKVAFFGRKMLRKVKSFTRSTVGPSTSGTFRRKPSHKMIVSRLRRFLAQRKDGSQKPTQRQQSPPQSFLEADWSDIEDDHRLPPEVLYMLRSVRVFGHLEKPFFLELCRFMETIMLRAGNFLFRIGDPDDSIYVVQHGLLDVFITDADGTDHLVKQVTTGNSIHSLLSILDVLTGHPGPFKSVSARAVTDSTILRLPAHAFKSMFEKFNESTVKVVQIIMIRLQRVTFSALHNYLGLSSELLKPESHGEKELLVHQLTKAGSATGSPARQLSNQAVAVAAPSAVAGSEDSSDGRGQPGHSSGGGTPHRRPQMHSERPPLPQRQTSELGSQLSDFEQALMRARATVVEDRSIVTSGTPPRRWSMADQHNEASSMAHQRAGTVLDEAHILDLASKDLVHILGLKDPTLLDNRLTLNYVRAGSIFCKQGDQDTSLFFMVKGTVSVLQNVVGDQAKEAMMFQAEPGEIIDVLAVLTGEPSFFTMRAKTDAIMAVVTKPDFYSIMRVEPFIVLNVAHTTVRRMSPFVRQIDYALDWQMIESGKALFRQGDSSDSIFIVQAGRLRSVLTTLAGKKELVKEFGRGELVGTVEVLTQNERATTVLAIRDTEMTKIPTELLNLIKLRYPQVVARLIHLLGTRILGNLQQRNVMSLQASVPLSGDGFSNIDGAADTNLATIAIVPVTEEVPLTNFSLELQHALLSIGPTVRLTSDIVKNRLGSQALDGVNEFRLFNWLSQQEDIHRMVLYQCDFQLTKWTKHCLRQADCILIVALGDRDPKVGIIEKELENIAVRAKKELVLLHKEETQSPRHTVEWLNARGWLSSHHHIRCPKRVVKYKSPAKTLEMYERLFETSADRLTDFARLARFLTGTSIGLVLGGGGARGIAHIGMIKAMHEAGIPVDMVGGTSMGSFIGALWAEERNVVRFTQRAREWSMGMTSYVKKIWDLTYPVTSMFTGWSFNESIENVFRERQIEDLWIPYFCISTNISNSTMRVHSVGSLWRYVRSSMSLSGYLPPLCDPIDGHLLLDGGYVNNLPADVMRAKGAKMVFAVDVGSQDDETLTNYGDSLSGWWLLWKRWNPWAKQVKVPDMAEVQSRLAYVSCVRQLQIVKNSDYCEYIRPPIDRYATMQFGSFDEILEVGFHHGKTLFSAWTKGGLLDNLFKEATPVKMETPKDRQQTKDKSHVPVMAYFTDLAEQVSRIQKPSKFYCADSEEDDLIYNEDEAANIMDGYDEDDDEYGNSDDITEEDSEEQVEEVKKVNPLSYSLKGQSKTLPLPMVGDLSENQSETLPSLHRDLAAGHLRASGLTNVEEYPCQSSSSSASGSSSAECSSESQESIVLLAQRPPLSNEPSWRSQANDVVEPSEGYDYLLNYTVGRRDSNWPDFGLPNRGSLTESELSLVLKGQGPSHLVPSLLEKILFGAASIKGCDVHPDDERYVCSSKSHLLFKNELQPESSTDASPISSVSLVSLRDMDSNTSIKGGFRGKSFKSCAEEADTQGPGPDVERISEEFHKEAKPPPVQKSQAMSAESLPTNLTVGGSAKRTHSEFLSSEYPRMFGSHMESHQGVTSDGLDSSHSCSSQSGSAGQSRLDEVCVWATTNLGGSPALLREDGMEETISSCRKFPVDFSSSSHFWDNSGSADGQTYGQVYWDKFRLLLKDGSEFLSKKHFYQSDLEFAKGMVGDHRYQDSLEDLSEVNTKEDESNQVLDNKVSHIAKDSRLDKEKESKLKVFEEIEAANPEAECITSFTEISFGNMSDVATCHTGSEDGRQQTETLNRGGKMAHGTGKDLRDDIGAKAERLCVMDRTRNISQLDDLEEAERISLRNGTRRNTDQLDVLGDLEEDERTSMRNGTRRNTDQLDDFGEENESSGFVRDPGMNSLTAVDEDVEKGKNRLDSPSVNKNVLDSPSIKDKTGNRPLMLASGQDITIADLRDDGDGCGDITVGIDVAGNYSSLLPLVLDSMKLPTDMNSVHDVLCTPISLGKESSSFGKQTANRNISHDLASNADNQNNVDVSLENHLDDMKDKPESEKEMENFSLGMSLNKEYVSKVILAGVRAAENMQMLQMGLGDSSLGLVQMKQPTEDLLFEWAETKEFNEDSTLMWTQMKEVKEDPNLERADTKESNEGVMWAQVKELKEDPVLDWAQIQELKGDPSLDWAQVEALSNHTLNWTQTKEAKEDPSFNGDEPGELEEHLDNFPTELKENSSLDTDHMELQPDPCLKCDLMQLKQDLKPNCTQTQMKELRDDSVSVAALTKEVKVGSGVGQVLTSELDQLLSSKGANDPRNGGVAQMFIGRSKEIDGLDDEPDNSPTVDEDNITDVTSGSLATQSVSQSALGKKKKKKKKRYR